MATEVVNLYSGKHYDVYIGRGRGSPWGNPYPISDTLSREEAIARYRDYLLGRPDLLARLGELRGKRLGCFCKPRPCHGDILAEFADNGVPGA